MQTNLVLASVAEPPRKRPIHVWVWIHRAIKQIALEQDTTIEAIAMEALEAYLSAKGITQQSFLKTK